MRARLALLPLLTCSALTQAAPTMLFDGAKTVLAYKDSFSVQVVDQTSDGCLPNPQAAKTAIEDALSKQGLKVENQEPKALGDTVVVSIIGNKLHTGKCMLHIESWLNHWLVANVPYAKQVEGGNQAYISHRHPLGESFHYTHPNDAHTLTRKASDRFAAQLKKDISEGRDFAEQHFPAMGEEYQRIMSPTKNQDS